MSTPSPAPRAAAPTPPVDDARIYELKRPDPNLLWHYLCLALLTTFAAPIVFVPLYFKYHTLRYKLDAEGISASWGILFRREVHLTYKRIQDIHVKRNFVERWLGIGTVEVQTAAGSSTSELSFEGMREFDALREFLYRRMRGHESAPAAAVGASSAPGGSEAEVVDLLRKISADLEATRRAVEGRV